MPSTRIIDLSAIVTPVPANVLPVDGATTQKITIQQVVDTGAPVASQAEAEAGTNNVKRMTPLSTAQAMEAQIGVTIASAAAGDLAQSALQPDAVGTTLQPFSDRLQGITIASGSTGQVLALQPDDSLAFTNAGAGDMITAQYDPDEIGANAFDASNQLDFVTTVIATKSIPAPVMSFWTSGYDAPGGVGAAQFKRIATPSPVEAWHRQSADGAYWQMADVELTPQMFGAKSGVASSQSSAFADWGNALQALVARGFVPRGEGAYRIDSTAVTITKSGVRIVMDSPTFDLSNAANGTRLFSISGSVNASISLASNTTAAASSVAVTAGAESGFAADDYVQVASETILDAGWSDCKIGELTQLLSTASGTLTSKTKLRGGPYTTAAGAFVRKINFVSGFEITGKWSVVGPTSSSVLVRAISANWMKDYKIEGLTAKFCHATTVHLVNCFKGEASRLFITDALESGTGYGINAVSATTNLVIRNSYFARVRHANTNTAATGEYGVQRDITYEDCICDTTINNGDAFDTHGGAENIKFVRCIALNSSASGFNIECASARLIDCESYNATNFSIRLSIGATIIPSDFAIKGGSFLGSGSHGISATAASSLNSTTTALIELTNVQVVAAAVGLLTGNSASGGTALVISNLQIKGGSFETTGSVLGAIYMQYDVTEFDIDTKTIQNLAGGSCIQSRGTHGKIQSVCIYKALPNGTSSSAAIRLQDASRISVLNCRWKIPAGTPTGSFGVRKLGTTANITEANNDFYTAGTPSG